MARILFLTSRLPWPPREGHQLRSWHLLKALAAQHEVVLLSFVRQDDDIAAADSLRDRLSGVELFPIASDRSHLSSAAALLAGVVSQLPYIAVKYMSQALRQRLAVLARDADLVHFDMLPLMQHADCVEPGTPVGYNAHNVEHHLLRLRAGNESNPLARIYLRSQLKRLRAFETAACQRADVVLACSPIDAEALRELAPDSDVLVVPNGVDLDANLPRDAPALEPSRGNTRLVFVGNMGWFPNRQGIAWFLDQVFPRILRVRPDAELVVIGKCDGFRVPAAVAPHVRMAGFVDDLRPLVQAAEVYVVPLQSGSGTRLKVLEAMALGKAIVTTAVGSEGIDLKAGENALFADQPEAFAQAVLALLDDPQRRERLGSAARACAQASYGWDAIGEQLCGCYARLLANGDSAQARSLA